MMAGAARRLVRYRFGWVARARNGLAVVDMIATRAKASAAGTVERCGGLGEEPVGGSAGPQDVNVGVASVLVDVGADVACHRGAVLPHVPGEVPRDAVVDAGAVVLAAAMLEAPLSDAPIGR